MVSKPTCSAPRVHRRESDKLIGVQRCSSVIPVHLTGEHPRRCGHNRDTMTAAKSAAINESRERHQNGVIATKNAINETNGNQRSDLSKEQGVTQSLHNPDCDVSSNRFISTQDGSLTQATPTRNRPNISKRQSMQFFGHKPGLLTHRRNRYALLPIGISHESEYLRLFWAQITWLATLVSLNRQF